MTEARLRELKITLPPAPTSLAVYTTYTKTGNLVHTAGHIPFKDDMKSLYTGKVGADVTTDEAAAIARRVGLLLIATLKEACGGNLDRVRVIKVVGFVNSTDAYTQQPEVINGCSNLIGEVFGKERGTHARSAVSVNALPRNVPVEIELIAEIARASPMITQVSTVAVVAAATGAVAALLVATMLKK